LAISTRGRWRKLAIAAWAIVAIVITIRLLTVHDVGRRSIYPSFIAAARHWIAGQSLYGADRMEFRYSPLFAAAFTPFNLLPDRAGNIVWRALNLAAYWSALGWWMRIVLKQSENENHRGLFLLFALPLSVGSLNNGQSNPLMVALILGALCLVHHQRWMLASIFLALAAHLKLYPLAFAVLLIALWPRQLWWRLPLAITGSVALCFIMQWPAYVAEQFHDWFAFLSGDLRLDQDSIYAYRDLRLLLNVVGLHPGHLIYFIIQVSGAVAIALICFAKRSVLPRGQLLALMYALVACWILLLGPATESSTYILLAPALAWLLIEAWTATRPIAERMALIVVCVLLGVTLIANWFPFVTKIHALGLQPLAVVIFAACVVYEALVSVKSNS
jgi:hypothetical protein